MNLLHPWRSTTVRLWVLGLLLAWLVAVPFTLEAHLHWIIAIPEPGPEGRPDTWSIFLLEGWRWTVWAMLLPLIWRLVRRYPIRPRAPWRSAAVHLPFAVGVGAIYLALQSGLSWWWFFRDRPFEDALGNLYKTAGEMSVMLVMLYGYTAGGFLAVDYARRARERELSSARIRAGLAQADLERMQAQLQPRYLLETLDAACYAMDTDPARAESLLVRLSELLRAALDELRHPVIPLAREIAILQRFADIESLRHGRACSLRADVPRALQSVRVPALGLLTLLVESAPGEIEGSASALELRARREGTHAVVEVRRVGALASPEAARRLTVRLREHFGPRASLSSGQASGATAGEVVVLRVPVPEEEGRKSRPPTHIAIDPTPKPPHVS